MNPKTKWNRNLLSLIILLILFLLPELSQLWQPAITPASKLKTTNNNPQAESPNSTTKLHLVTRVIDGDTIELQSGEIIRYIGIDTPEIARSGKKAECFSDRATQENAALVLNKQVRLEKDVSEADKYSRLLRYVFILDETTGKENMVNQQLVRHGYAEVKRYPPDTGYHNTLQLEQEHAKNNALGIWGNC